MYLIVNDDYTRQCKALHSWLHYDVSRGVLKIFKVEDGKFYRLTRTGDWEEVPETENQK